MIHTTPFPFQDEDANRIGALGGRALVANDPGLGKSFTALLYAQRAKLRPIIVVCPASVKWIWQSEARKHLGLRSQVLEGIHPKQNGHMDPPPLTIINYDILGKSRRGKGWVRTIRRMRPQLIIIDECHYLGSRTAKRTRWVRQLCQGVPHVVALSGTPLVNRPAELWPTLNILYPLKFPSWFSFGHRFCKPKKEFWGWTFKGATNVELLHSKLKKIMIRRRKIDVLKDLPAKIRSVLPLPLSRPKEYAAASKDFIGWLSTQTTSKRKLRKAAKAEAVVKLGYLKRLSAKLKLPSVIEWVDNFLSETDEKLILFAVHKKVIKRLRNRWGDACVVVDGSVTGRDRQLAVKKFLTHRNVRIFIGNIRAAGVGWSAKGVSNVAFAELDWTPGLHSQAEDRVSGIERGQRGISANIMYFVAKDTIEEHLVKIIQAKSKTIAKVLDGKGRAADLDIFDRLCEQLRKGKS